jgi:thioredoxin-like negative regulator of GroEL
MFAPIFSKVALRNLGKAVFAKLNTDEYQIAAQTYGIRGIPTMVIFHNGSEIGRQTGALPEPALVELVGEVVRVTSAQKTPKTE